MAIEQIISKIPALRHRSTVVTPEDQDDFVNKFEENNDHLVENLVPELNNYALELNNTTNTINTAEANAKSSADSAEKDKNEIATLKEEIQQVVATLPDGSIVDSETGNTTTWSSNKINEELGKKALKNGSIDEFFLVKEGTEDNHAITKKQLENMTKEVFFPSGTRMLFQQSAAPTGWSKESNVDYNDNAIRLVTDTVTQAGSVAFSTAFKSQNVGATSLTIAQLPSMTGDSTAYITTRNGASTPTASGVFRWSAGKLEGFGSSSNWYSGRLAFSAGSGSSHTHSINLAVKYTDVIVCQKD